MDELLSIKNLYVRFSGIVAVDCVSLSLDKGKIYGLIGTNGAGKSTLINMVSGNLKPTSGEIIFGDRHIEGVSAHAAAAMGISRTFQNLRVFKNMTVLENIVTSRQGKYPYSLADMLFHTEKYRQAEESISRDAQEILRFFRIISCARMKASSLAYGQQRRLEIARCMALEPKLLLLDEPAAGMNQSEKSALAEDINSAKVKYPDMTIVLIEHDMKMVMELCEHIFVMAQGKLIEEGTPEEISASGKVIKAYMGG